MTRTLPLVLIASGSLGFGAYVAGASARDERAVLERFVREWRQHQYTRMYSLLTPFWQHRISSTEFIAEFQGAAQIATLRDISAARLTSVQPRLARASVTARTWVFGTLRKTLEIPLAGSGGGTRVRFSSSLLFPGLAPGELLDRRSTLGRRGTLLAENGEVLARGSTLATSIPSVASAIAGTLGPIPAGETAQYAMAGYPPGAKVGQDGLEAVFQSELAGRLGGTLLEGSRVIARASPRKGATVRTTINPQLEADAVAGLGNHYGGITVLDPRNGHVEAAAGIAFTALQPPGSTFKIITASAALQAGLATPNTVYPYESSTYVGGFKMQNAGGEVCGGTLTDAFANSCDTTFAPLGVQIGARRLVAMAERYGFNHGIRGLPGVLTGSIPPADQIGGALSVGSSAIGQGMVQASTLEMADAAAAVADGGRRPIPTMNAHSRTRFVRVTSGKVAGELQQMMVAVVDYGTGTGAQIPGITVAGKTGTAELANTAGKKNDAKETDAWFVAYAPVPDPKVVVCAMFPSAGYGGKTAAPVVRAILESALGMG